MLKKLTLLAMSVAALLAFAAPAAQATGPLITNSAGEAAKTITAVGTNVTTHTAVGTLECTTVSLHGEISTNANTTAEGNGTGTAFGTPGVVPHAGPCKSGSLNVEITDITLSKIHMQNVGGVTSGTANFTYTFDLRSGSSLIAECTFSGTNVPVSRTGTDTINVNGKLVKSGGSAFCPSEGTLTGDFTVLDEFGNPAHIH